MTDRYQVTRSFLVNEDTILNVLIFIISLSNILDRVHSRKCLDRSLSLSLSPPNFTVTFFFPFPFFLSFFLSSNYATRVHARKHIQERRLGHWVIVVRCYRVRERRRDGAAPPHCTTFPTHDNEPGGAATLPPFPFSYTPLTEISTPGAREQRQPLPKRETEASIGAGAAKRHRVIHTRIGLSRPPRLASTTSKGRPAVDALRCSRADADPQRSSRATRFTFHACTQPIPSYESLDGQTVPRLLPSSSHGFISRFLRTSCFVVSFFFFFFGNRSFEKL